MFVAGTVCVFALLLPSIAAQSGGLTWTQVAQIVLPTLVDRVGIYCFALSTIACNSCEMNDCIPPRQLEEKRKENR